MAEKPKFVDGGVLIKLDPDADEETFLTWKRFAELNSYGAERERRGLKQGIVMGVLGLFVLVWLLAMFGILDDIMGFIRSIEPRGEPGDVSPFFEWFALITATF